MEKFTISVSEMALMLGISRPKAYELAKSEGFPSVSIGRRIVIPCAQLEEWLARQADSTVTQ